MTDKPTLREEFAAKISNIVAHPGYELSVIDRLVALLEGAGSPAHMRVAAELRGD